MVRQKDDDRPDAPLLGEAVRKLRSWQGLSRRELAEAAGISYPYLSEIEGGKKTPSSRTLGLLSRALGVAASEVMRMADELGQERPPRSVPRGSYFHDSEPANDEVAAMALPAPPPERPLASQLRAPESEPSLSELVAIAERLRPQDVRLLIDLARRLVR